MSSASAGFEPKLLYCYRRALARQQFPWITISLLSHVIQCMISWNGCISGSNRFKYDRINYVRLSYPNFPAGQFSIWLVTFPSFYYSKWPLQGTSSQRYEGIVLADILLETCEFSCANVKWKPKVTFLRHRAVDSSVVSLTELCRQSIRSQT